MPPAHHRRQSSDPFGDASPPPPPPPKQDMLSAVRDSVTVKAVPQPKRSNTSGTTTPPRSRRSHSTDSVPSPVDKSAKPTRPKNSKKASMHADIIDRLDFSGVGAAMLHHDGPYDACAPTRNKHKHKAPMMAWGAGDNPNDQLSNVPDFSNDRRLSPLAQSTLAAMSNYDSPYNSASLYPGSPGSPDSMPKKRVDALAEAWGVAEPEPFEEFFAGGGDKSAASSIKNGKESHSSASRRAKDAREAYKEYLEDGRSSRRPRSTMPPPQPISLPGSRPHDAPSSPTAASAPGVSDMSPNLTHNVAGEGSPRRSKSLMQRIRKMRDAPNVPVTYEEEGTQSDSPPDSLESGNTNSQPAATAPRPTHKHQTSFLGRFARSPGGGVTQISPTSERSAGSAEFVYVDEPTLRDKDLPSPPGDKHNDYFGDAAATPGRRLGRKTSLMKKVVRGVRSRSTK